MIKFCPCTDLTITTEKLMELFAPLDPEKVNVLGVEGYLDLPQSEIDRIQKDYQSPAQRKEAYLDIYVHQHPCPTWSRIARVLCLVILPQQADLVKNTYIKGTQKILYRDYYLRMNGTKLCMFHEACSAGHRASSGDEVYSVMPFNSLLVDSTFE